MKNVYVVMGSTGEYSDRNEWSVKAYLSESAAMNHVSLASMRAKEIYATYPKYYSIPDALNEHDSFMRMDYTGTSYYYMTVELNESI